MDFSSLDIFDQPTSSLVPFVDPPKHHVFRTDERDPTVLHLYIDNSSLERFQTCPRSAYFYLLQRRQANRGRRPLEFGSAIHAALASFISGSTVEAALDALHSVLEASSPCDANEWRTAENCEKLFCSWVEEYSPFQFSTILHPNGKPFVEQGFDIILTTLEVNSLLPCTRSFLCGPEDSPNESMLIKDLDEPPATYVSSVVVHWTGKIDAVITHKFHKGVWVMDHKTTSIGGPTYFSSFLLSQQMLGYCWAVRHMMRETEPGFSPAGLMLDTLFNRRPSRTGKSMEFSMQPYPYEDWQYDEWETDVTHFVADFIANLVRGVFPKATAWCFGKYGACDYHHACVLAPDQRESHLASPEFRNVDWNPLAE